jgi:hypothetical protein
MLKLAKDSKEEVVAHRAVADSLEEAGAREEDADLLVMGHTVTCRGANSFSVERRDISQYRP